MSRSFHVICRLEAVSYLEVSFAMPVLYLYQLKAEQIILDLNKTNSRKKKTLIFVPYKRDVS